MEIKNYRHLFVLITVILLAGCKKPGNYLPRYYFPSSSISVAESFDILEQEIDYLDENSLIIFDVDETLFSLNRTVQGQQSLFEQIATAKYSVYQTFLVRQKLRKIVPLAMEHRIATIIERLQDKGIKVIALTSGGYGIHPVIGDLSEFRIQMLNNLGISFSGAFFKIHKLEMPSSTDNNIASLFYKGVLFSAPFAKGNTLEQFLLTIKWKPSCLLFFDNDEKNVNDVAQTAQNLGIPYQSFQYTGYQNIPEEIIRRFNRKVQHLMTHDTWLSDRDAEKLPAT